MFRRWCIPLAGLALVIGSVAASAPATAAGRAPARHPTRPAVHLIRPGAPMIGHGFRGNAQQSSNWSGYAARNGTFHSVSANWTDGRPLHGRDQVLQLLGRPRRRRQHQRATDRE